MIKFVESTPWWFLIVLYITTLVIGVFVGAPMMIEAYDLTLSVEVKRLFVLMPLIRIHYLLPLLIIAAFGLKVVREKNNKQLTKAFIFASVILTPCIFYGLHVSYIFDLTGA
ncbi:hypothetical protein [Pseudoalteromonas luteoviolacea]|uniref:Uncharacterized protein n=1 Tax=Pseudoalteromonas luteoviolacea NCIMB 1942 TaxID=1365253 RepID=A0A167HPC9_9GAMM|nr:hypothetical protein [Pseudoalteromonas luteoviolacea]KZN58353.1 hypothetical protein N482_22475 [Pseudoalteromonas luteoviolacea NCIMB 1942]KZW98500.1 hypothetical protein JL49_22925 [Pseudoalteromonas luteoviolacea]